MEGLVVILPAMSVRRSIPPNQSSVLRMAAPSAKSGLTVTPPTFAIKGAHNSLLLEMTGLGQHPTSGRLLRGLTPYLDEQGAKHVLLLTGRKRREPWSQQADQVVHYQELVHWERAADGGVYRGVCGKDAALGREEIIQAFESEPLSVIDWAARRLEAAVVSNREPMRLEICYVEKPWGREAWYTGIEKRGISRVRSATGNTELPYALGMFPVPLIGEDEAPPILLKTLEPLPDAVYGDLYLEVHREKWEVYVVLAVDPAAWPDGIGCLRAGLDPESVESYRAKHGARWEHRLIDDLEEAIRRYEQVRRQIDGMLDTALRGRGENPDEPVSPALHRALLADLPEALLAAERDKRAAVERYLGKVPLRRGDVVRLPPGVLHSLQRGVKVIEFQTPTYERLIAMFAQKVLTQPHWDVAESMRVMEKAAYTPPTLEVLQDDDGLKVERIVDFPQFQVDRVALSASRTLAIRTDENNQYQLLVVTMGEGQLLLADGRVFPLEPEAGYLLPATIGEYSVKATTAQHFTYLKAVPRLDGNTPTGESEKSVDDVLENTW